MSSQSQLEEIDLNIAKIDSTINALQAKRRELVERRQGLQDALARQTIVSAPLNEDSYEQEDFSWSDNIKRLAKTQFKISSFRQCQLPIINAALDQKRDLFVVLPTGGGKSLCYQLPTLLETGFTLVISPLVSLIRDQVFQLEEMNVPAVALTGASTKEEVANVQLGMAPLGGQEPPFKLLYVTPEKIAKSKRFMARLDKAYNCGALTRIVVDEAHCCSQQGHDFRYGWKHGFADIWIN
jgi:ATP-dependent DNA helicase Q1